MDWAACLSRLAWLLEKRSYGPASGPRCLAEVDVTAQLLPGPKSAESAEHLVDLADSARRALRAE
eukprot:3525912-Alexandrium_andersonii.AAC.1